MPVAVGDELPDVELQTMRPDGPTSIGSREALGKGRVLLFALPGAFTPTCSDHHLPGYVLRAEDLRAKGVDTIACISVNDVFVMDAWGKSQGVDESVLMLADGNGAFATAMGLDVDFTKFGMGVRSQRYAAIIEDGVITHLAVEPGAGLDVSSAESLLAVL